MVEPDLSVRNESEGGWRKHSYQDDIEHNYGDEERGKACKCDGDGDGDGVSVGGGDGDDGDGDDDGGGGVGVGAGVGRLVH